MRWRVVWEVEAGCYNRNRKHLMGGEGGVVLKYSKKKPDRPMRCCGRGGLLFNIRKSWLEKKGCNKEDWDVMARWGQSVSRGRDMKLMGVKRGEGN